MNHDYAHCLDYEDDCPKNCFRGELVRDLIFCEHRKPSMWKKFYDGWFEYYYNTATGEKKFKLDEKDLEI